MLDFTKDGEKMFDADKIIDQVEKSTLAVLAYVKPEEVSKTLSHLTVAHADFTRANIEAFKSITAIAKSTTTEFTKNFEKATKTK